MDYATGFELRESVKDRAALPIGTKLYFTGGQFDGFPCMASALSSFSDEEALCPGDGTLLDIKVRRLLGIYECALTFDLDGAQFRRKSWRWASSRGVAIADYFETYGPYWCRGHTEIDKALPYWGEDKEETILVAAWATTATVRYAWRLEHVETILRSEEVSRAIA